MKRSESIEEKLDQGVREFNSGAYFEAHESWEQVWKVSEGPSRSYYKAIVQACGVFVHLAKGRTDPALRLSKRSLELLAEAEAHFRLHGERPVVEIDHLETVLLKAAALIQTQLFDKHQFESLVRRCRAVRKGG